MRLHKRFWLVQQMENRLQKAVLDVIYAKPKDVAGDEYLAKALAKAGQTNPEERILTDAEVLSIVAKVFGEHVQNHAKYRIRFERHGRDDVPGGQE